MEVAHASTGLPEVATSHLSIAAPFGPAIPLHTQHTREGDAGLPASHNAYHDKQLVQQTTAVRRSQPRGWGSSHFRDRAT